MTAQHPNDDAVPVQAASTGDAKPRDRVLLIDFDDHLRRALQLLLAGNGYDVRSFASATQALADSASREAEFLIVGDVLADASAAEVLGQLRARGWNGRAVRIGDSRDSAHGVDGAAGFVATIPRHAGRLELLGAMTR